jgi:phosphoenolpyruvate synthase/pyruvate phosphate dikinase
MSKYIVELNESCRSNGIGNKARNLIFLMKTRVNVPTSWACDWAAQESFILEESKTLNKLRIELMDIIRPNISYAVRSSANTEDGDQFSFAGQFQSFLNVKGVDEVISAIMDVWKSANSSSLLKYMADNNIHQTVKMGVIIQEMIDSVYSGVSFSKNPLTGLSEVIVEANLGLGDNIHQSTPLRWVNKWGEWLEESSYKDFSRDLIKEVVFKTKEIAKIYGNAVDIEWAYNGNQLYFLQVRKITAADVAIYSNRISKEMLPGIIKPLVYSVNTTLINYQWVNILTRLAGNHSITSESLTGHFFYRAYFNMATFGKVFEKLGMPYESLELMMGLENEGSDKPKFHMGSKTIRLLPRFLTFFLSFIRIESQFNRQVAKKIEEYRLSNKEIQDSTSIEKLWQHTQSIFDDMKPVVYFNIILPLFAMMYNKLLSNQLKKSNIDIRNIDLSHIRANALEYSPHTALHNLNAKYFNQDLIDHTVFEKDILEFLDQFGHFSDSGNDFSSKPWREDPQLIKRMIETSSVQQSENSDKIHYKNVRLPWMQRWFTNILFRRTSRFAVHREAISYIYTYGYGRFRTCFLKIGEYFVSSDIIEQSQDIFYLYYDEVRDIVESGLNTNMKKIIEDRKQQINLVKDVPLPELIFGNQQPPIINEELQEYRGIPTSLGTYTGEARVLMGLSEFEKLKQGDILIIPYSDVGWTPLFSKARAVISESGGMLSHSSIIAREYHIPAVVSVKGACNIKDGTILTVNGFTGQIEVVKKAGD